MIDVLTGDENTRVCIVTTPVHEKGSLKKKTTPKVYTKVKEGIPKSSSKKKSQKLTE